METSTLPLRVKELELERLQIADELKTAEAKQLVIEPDHIEFLLRQFMKNSEDEQEYRRKVINGFISEVYLYDNRLLVYYNINKAQPNLASSDLALLESDEFDQRALCSTKS